MAVVHQLAGRVDPCAHLEIDLGTVVTPRPHGERLERFEGFDALRS